MSYWSLARLGFCILMAWGGIYLYMQKQNELTNLRLVIPALHEQVKALHEENQRLKYEIEQFESPIHLMELAHKPEFSHLKYPNLNEIVILEEP